MSDVTMQLEAHFLVDRLAQPHEQATTATYRFAGKLYRDERNRGYVPSLLEQLRDLVGNAVGSGGNAAGFEAKAPLNVQAADLLDSITAQAAQWYRTQTGRRQPHSPEANLEIVHSQLMFTGEPMDEFVAGMRGWVEQIERLQNPVRTSEIKGSCPGCRQQHVWVETDGERKRASALVAAGDTVRCQNCDTSWKGKELHDLKQALDVQKHTVAE